MRALGRRYRPPLTRFLAGEDGDALIRHHPQPDVWSALEYACHVRDVFSVQRERMARARVEDGYTATPMGREELVTARRYNEQDPSVVLDELAANAEALAGDMDTFGPTDWARTMVYSYPSVAERSLRWVGSNTVHEGHHHLLDIGRVLRQSRGR